MSYANYSEIEHKVANHEHFNSGNRRTLSEKDGGYSVISYATTIGRYTPETGHRINNSRYSQTTSRLQSILKRAWPDAVLVEDEGALFD